MSRILAAFILLVAASAAFAQDRDEATEAALERAVESLRSGVFHFEYDVSLQDGRITGSGYGTATPIPGNTRCRARRPLRTTGSG